MAFTPMGPRIRVIVATHPATSTPARVGTTREGVVYETVLYLLATIGLYALRCARSVLAPGWLLRRFLSDEDKEQDCDRWCSYTANGQEFCQILSQWIWKPTP